MHLISTDNLHTAAWSKLLGGVVSQRHPKSKPTSAWSEFLGGVASRRHPKTKPTDAWSEFLGDVVSERHSKTKPTAYGESLIYWRIQATGVIERNSSHAMTSDYQAAVVLTIIAYCMVESFKRAARSPAMPATMSAVMPALRCYERDGIHALASDLPGSGCYLQRRL